jgi:hypothetical protein
MQLAMENGVAQATEREWISSAKHPLLNGFGFAQVDCHQHEPK